MPSFLHGFALPLLRRPAASTLRSSSFLASSPRFAASGSPRESSSHVLRQLRGMGMEERFTTLLQKQKPSLLSGLLAKIGLLLEEGLTVQQLNLVVQSHRFRGAHHLLRQSLPRLELIVAFFKCVQVEKQALSIVLIRQPTVLSMRVEGLERKLKVLQSFGMEGKDVGRAVVRHPRVLTLSSQKLEERLTFWRDFGLKNVSICRIMQAYPELFCLDCSLKMKSLLERFESYGFRKDVIFLSIVRYPRCLKPSMENLSRNMELLQQLGFTRSSKEFMVASFLLACYRTERLEAGFHWLTSCGFCVEDAKQLVRRCPTALIKRPENTEKVLDYLLNVLKRDMEEVVAFPRCLCYSLERRIQRRFAILAERLGHLNLTSKYSLSYILACTDATFEERLQSQRRMAGFAVSARQQQ